jgi:hypothetical protein
VSMWWIFIVLWSLLNSSFSKIENSFSLFKQIHEIIIENFFEKIKVIWFTYRTRSHGIFLFMFDLFPPIRSQLIDVFYFSHLLHLKTQIFCEMQKKAPIQHSFKSFWQFSLYATLSFLKSMKRIPTKVHTLVWFTV